MRKTSIKRINELYRGMEIRFRFPYCVCLKLHIFAAVTLLLSACSNCSEKEKTMVCGVPVKGTAWELAASIANNGDGSFIPECVDANKDKAYIKGWLNTNVTTRPYTTEPYDDGFLPAEVVCDIEKGTVTHALVITRQ